MKKIIGHVLAFALALLILFALGFFLLPLAETVNKTPVPGSADWMKRLPDDFLLSDILIPGTHDSATQYVQLAWFSKCQDLSISEQLNAGCRYLDIRLGDAEKGSPYPRLTHGFTNCKSSLPGGALTLDTVLDDCYAFLKQHPAETVLFAVKHEHGDSSVAAIQRVMQDLISKQEQSWLLTDTIPTLGEARGKLVLLRRWEDEAGLGKAAGIPFRWADQKDREDTSLAAAREPQGGYTLWVQDRFQYDTDEKWAAFTEGLKTEREAGDVLLSFLSTNGSGAYGHPWKYAKALNEKLEALRRSDLNGWIIVDFATPKLAQKIYEANF